MWFLSQLCTEIGVSLQEVARCNIEKLDDRRARVVIGGSGDTR